MAMIIGLVMALLVLVGCTREVVTEVVVTATPDPAGASAPVTPPTAAAPGTSAPATTTAAPATAAPATPEPPAAAAVASRRRR